MVSVSNKTVDSWHENRHFKISNIYTFRREINEKKKWKFPHSNVRNEIDSIVLTVKWFLIGFDSMLFSFVVSHNCSVVLNIVTHSQIRILLLLCWIFVYTRKTDALLCKIHSERSEEELIVWIISFHSFVRNETTQN